MATGGSRSGGSGSGDNVAAPTQQLPNLSTLPPIERLTGRENWSTWKFAVETFLELEDLWEVVKPTANADGSFPAVDQRKDRKARAKIILLLDPINYIHVKDAKTARECWAQLEAAFEDKGLTRRVGLLRKLITTSLTACDSVDQYVTQIISTAHQLRGVGFDISEEWIGTLLLAGLPDEYKPMIMALENSGTAITGDSIKTKLLQEMPTQTDRTAFYGKRMPQREPRKKQGAAESRPAEQEQPKGPKCKRCKKYGHIARDCHANRGSAFSVVLSTNHGADNGAWYFDSGASEHFTNNRNLLVNARSASGSVVAADKVAMNIVASGLVKLDAKCTPDSPPIEVNGVKFIPEMANNLLSVSQIVRRGHVVQFSLDGVKVIDPSGVVIATGCHDVEKGLFRFEEKKFESKAASSLACTSSDIETWHRRMGHLNVGSLKQLKGGLVSGIQFEDAACGNCVICAMGKQSRLPFPKKGHRASQALEVVHSDICGPMEETSLGGCRYYLSFTDDMTRRISIYFLATKSEGEVLRAFNHYHSQAERQTGCKMKFLRTDNGKEYTNKSFQNRLRELGIRHQTSTEYTPEQNGLAERVNRTIVERARCMLFEAKLPKAFWAEAVAAATYLVNRSPTKGHKLTPEEAWSGRKPDLSHVRVFGAKAMAHIPKQKRRKWDAKSRESILVGFDEDTKAYRLYDPVTRQVFKSRDVIFISEPSHEPAASVPVPVKPKQVRTFVSLDFEEPPADVVEVIAANPPEEAEEQVEPAAEEEGEPEQSDGESVDMDTTNYFSQIDTSESEASDGDVTIMALPPRQTSNPPESQVLRRSGRERALPGKYSDFILPSKGLPSYRFSGQRTVQPTAGTSSGSALTTDSEQQRQPDQAMGSCLASKVSGDPRSCKEALQSADAERWKAAMIEEYEALVRNNTWELVDLPPGENVIGSKWLFKTKEDEKGNIVRHKARIVAQGFSQKFGVDYDEVFAPVAKQVTFRTLLTVAAWKNLTVKHVDVKTAYLNGELEEVIYMRQPEGFQTGNDTTVCRLRRSLYGLKQSARVWNKKIDSVFKAMGFTQSRLDPCLYIRRKGGAFTYIIIYVDDMVIVAQSEEEFRSILEHLEQQFAVTNLGDLRHFLGMEVERDQHGFKLNQQAYIAKLVKRFGLENAKPSKIPIDPAYLKPKEEKAAQLPTNQTKEPVPLPNNQKYISLIGGLLYVALHTRPDIAVAVTILSQKNSCPNQEDWDEAKRVLKYLAGTSDFKLALGSNGKDLSLYADADYAGDKRDGKSKSGHLIMLGGGLMEWSSKKQTCVAVSTTEAELVALAEGCQELIWTKQLLEEIGVPVTKPTPVYEDNQSCIKVIVGDRVERRTKHIVTKFFFVRDLHKQQQINLQYCPTESMIADALTKPLQRVRLEYLRRQMGVIQDQHEEEC